MQSRQRNYFKWLVTMFAMVFIALLWWHHDGSQPASPSIESTMDISPTGPEPIAKIDLTVESDMTNQENKIEAAQSIETSDGVVVHGRVINKQGQGLAGLNIEISPLDRSAWHQNVYSTSTDSQGEYQFDAIPPDIDYRIEVLASGAHEGTLLGPVTVVHDMLAVMIVLDSIELVTVDGMIVDVDDAPVPDFEILVQNLGIAYPGRKIVSDTSGFFLLDRFPAGELQLSTSGVEHFNITGITLVPGEYRHLRIALDKGGYHLSGWVSDEFDAPIAQARVTLTSELRRQDYHSSSYRFVVTDSSGNFAFTELGGQAHQLSIDAIGYETQVLDYRFQSFADALNIHMRRKGSTGDG